MIVMGLDQHRGQVTAEWIDTDKSDRADARHLRELLMIAGLPERGSRPITSWTCACGCGCVTRCQISAASGSSASRRCSITTAVRSGGI